MPRIERYITKFLNFPNKQDPSGQLAVRDAEVAEAGEVLEAALGQPGLVAHQFGVLDGELPGITLKLVWP